MNINKLVSAIDEEIERLERVVDSGQISVRIEHRSSIGEQKENKFHSRRGETPDSCQYGAAVKPASRFLPLRWQNFLLPAPEPIL
jgi:hypothetical protein